MHNPHHLMVLMGENMAVPDIAARLVEGRFDPGNLTRQGGHHIFGRIFDIFIGRISLPAHSGKICGDLETHDRM